VLEEDAVFAIYLYEEAMTSRYGRTSWNFGCDSMRVCTLNNHAGHSLVGIKPTPHFKDNNTEFYIGKECDARMRQFHLYLLRFCASHGYLGMSAREE
jgi:hypothetical protein